MPREKAPAFQFYVKDWRSSRPVQRMSFKERGMYLEMLIEQWEAGSLPDDPVAIRVLLGGSPGDWQKSWGVLRPNFQLVDGRLVNRRLEKERDKQAQFRQKQSDKAVARWKKDETAQDAAALPRHSQTTFRHMPRSEPGNALHLQSSIADCSLQVAPKSSGSKRPIFSGQRFTVFEWQLEGLERLLGPHYLGFDIHAWFFELDEQAVTSQELVPQRDHGVWLLAKTQAEALRRGLPMATAADSDEAMWAEIAKKGPSVRS